MKKNIKVILSEEANKQYLELNKIVSEEISNGVRNSLHQQLLKSIEHKTNLWKINLSNYWRMIYTLRTNEIEITNFVLEFLDHQTYDKVFGYRKK